MLTNNSDIAQDHNPKTVSELWQQIEELHYSIWENCGDPEEKGT